MSENNIGKEWKDINEQLEILKERGMRIKNEVQAATYLKSLGYYRLSGYWYPFRKIEKDTHSRKVSHLDDFKENSFFEDAISIYNFDKKLRENIFSALESIETGLKMAIAYEMGHIDTCAHHNKGLFEESFSDPENSEGYCKWFEKYENSIQQAERKKVAFVKHNIENYGKLPIWVAVELWDFGSMSKYYSNLKEEYRNTIAKRFSVNGKVLASWIKSLNYIRNICAHHMRIWNANLTVRSTEKIKFLYGLRTNRIFYYLCVIKYLLDKLELEGEEWADKITKLLHELPKLENDSINIYQIGAVREWGKNRLWTSKI